MDAVKVRGRRAESAEATRAAVIAAAHAAFVEHGYGAATIDDIARRAGVSRPTVFAVGGKAKLLSIARDVAMAGDLADVVVRDRASFQAVLAEVDPVTTLVAFARHVTAVAARYAALDEVLRQGAGTDPDLQALWDESEVQRRRAARLVVDDVRRKGELSLPAERAADVLWLLMAPDHHRRLTVGRSWSSASYARWLGDAMVALLLAPTRDARSGAAPQHEGEDRT